MDMTIQQVIDIIVAATPGAPFPQTVDTIKTGDPAQQVTRIVTAFSASHQTIQQAIELGANLIVTHEPTFYNHRDETKWLHDDPVYKAKRRLLEEHNIVVWRFHDYLHAQKPDRTLAQLLRRMAWESYALPEMPELCHIPPVPLQELLEQLQTRLDCKGLRFVGDPALVCRGVGVLVGAPGGEMQIGVLGREDVDVLVCGEISEWETSEYARDALQQGRKKALVIIGHAVSEEPAMADVGAWLKSRLPGIAVTFLPGANPIEWL